LEVSTENEAMRAIPIEAENIACDVNINVTHHRTMRLCDCRKSLAEVVGQDEARVEKKNALALCNLRAFEARSKPSNILGHMHQSKKLSAGAPRKLVENLACAIG